MIGKKQFEMMKKRYLFLMLGALAAGAHAELRTAAEAETIARAFLTERLAEAPASIDLQQVAVPVDRRHAAAAAAPAAAPVYLYRTSGGEAFVVVSGSTLLRPVLGYGDAPADTDEALPDNLASWLTWLGEATAYVERHPEASLAGQAVSTTPVAPLLGNIAWDQTSPWSDQCPNRYYVGCMATAMAQIIYYYRYPEHGTGSHSYRWNGQTLSVDFAAQTYDYGLMFDRYTNSTTAAQRAEVAKLSYHCGVAVDMGYGAGGSGAYDFMIVQGMTRYFAYNPHAAILDRTCFTVDDWNAQLIGELTGRRPILFCGQSSSGGHAFVLDGINANGLYHVNWGWSGAYNGYFDVTVLNPEGYGSGATDSEDGFTHVQTACVRLAPEAGVGGYVNSLRAGVISTNTPSVAVGGQAHINVNNIQNYGIRLTGTACALIMQGADTVALAEVGPFSCVAASENYGASATMNGYYTMPALPDGTYQVYAAVSEGGDRGLTDVIRCRATAPSYLNLTVAGGTATFSKASYDIDLTLSDWRFSDEDIYAGHATTINVDVTNNSDQTLAGQFKIEMTGSIRGTLMAQSPVTIAPGATGTVTFRHSFPTAGEGTLQLYAARMNLASMQYDWTTGNYGYAYSYTKVGDVLSLSVHDDGTGSAAFRLAGVPYVSEGLSANNTVTQDEEIAVALPLTNQGGAYSGEFRVDIYNKKTMTGTPLLTWTTQGGFAASTTSDAVVRGRLSGLKAQTIYYGKATYKRYGEWQAFETAPGVSNLLELRVVSASSGIEGIAVDAELDDLTPVYDILGRFVARVPLNSKDATYGLPSGIYIINNKKIVIR